MGSLRLTLCTGLLALTALTPEAAYATSHAAPVEPPVEPHAAAPVAAAATAAATDGPGVAVIPVSPAPGTDIVLRISGCAARTATATSAAFVADARLAGVGGTLVGESRVRSTLEPGSYDVLVVCGGVRIKGAFMVAAGPSVLSVAASPAPSAAIPVAPVTPASSASPARSASPVAPVRAGGGGTAGRASDDAVAAVSAVDAVDAVADVRAAGPGKAQAVTGLVLAGVATVAVALRSFRRRRGLD